MAFSAQIPGQNLHKQFSSPIFLDPIVSKDFELPKPNFSDSTLLYRNNSQAASERPTGKTNPKKRVPKSHRERYRDADNLKRWQADELYQAAPFAAAIGLALKTSVTIAWNHAIHQLNGITFKSCTKRLCRLLRKQGVIPTYIYVHENPGGQYPNTHFLIHRGKISFDKLQTIFNDAFGALDDTAINIKSRHWRSLTYLFKGASQQTNKAYARNREPGGQGTINFKRSGTTQNIGQSARKGA